jgi:hypothetical protein
LRTRQEFMKHFLWALLLFLSACGTQAEPTATVMPASVWIQAADVCTPSQVAWTLYLEDPPTSVALLCGGWLERGEATLAAWAACWQQLPPAEDANLERAQLEALDAIDLFEQWLYMSERFCERGNAGDLSAAAEAMVDGAALLEQAADHLKAYPR